MDWAARLVFIRIKRGPSWQGKNILLAGVATWERVDPDYEQYRWRYPSLSIHGVEGAFSAPGAKTVIPAKVIGKFSIRTVPNMEPKDVDELVFQHLNFEWEKTRTNNTMKIELAHAGKWWVSSPKHWNFAAASKAVESVFKVKPDMTREGGSIPVTLTFEQATGKNVLLLPMGSSTDAAHSINGEPFFG